MTTLPDEKYENPKVTVAMLIFFCIIYLLLQIWKYLLQNIHRQQASTRFQQHKYLTFPNYLRYRILRTLVKNNVGGYIVIVKILFFSPTINQQRFNISSFFLKYLVFKQVLLWFVLTRNKYLKHLCTMFYKSVQGAIKNLGPKANLTCKWCNRLAIYYVGPKFWQKAYYSSAYPFGETGMILYMVKCYENQNGL